jgi:hypothetical protein
MVPTAFMVLDSLPRTSNNKIDRRALPDIPERPVLSAADLPTGQLEQQLAAIWAASLKRERIGIHENFFELGGDSLLVLTMTLEVERATGQRVPPAFFKEPTIRHLARLLSENAGAQAAGGFALQGDQRRASGVAWRRRAWVYEWYSRLRKFAKQALQTVSPAGLFEWFLSFQIRTLSLQEVRSRVLRIAGSSLLHNTAFRRPLGMFRRLLKSLGAEESLHPFRMNLAGELLFKIIQGRAPFQPDARALPPYWVERERLLTAAPVDELDRECPVEGFAALHAAPPIRPRIAVLPGGWAARASRPSRPTCRTRPARCTGSNAGTSRPPAPPGCTRKWPFTDSSGCSRAR